MKPALILTLGCAMVSCWATRAIAQTSIDGDLTLSNGNPKGSLTGTAIGSHDLPSTVLGRSTDQAGHDCLGFSSLSPNHRLTLQTPIANLTLSVNSGQDDTTLAVRGPNGLLLCGDDTVGTASAQVTAPQWPAGTYEVWVGTFKPGMRSPYRLTAE
ncbi:hypothetical protein H6G52_05280 [Limnothrix sp. FACHB-881]|uniref:hypothetical protein n=1 Tax=unclassified Limnothrix TaxID=2632864 RepID=UPI000C1626D6|nr:MULTISPECIES: hypothetical protein [unclassified Limnothrix]MBD2555027.1 hypothetical protein [Limnothrix sp. FACHB-708]MBD2591878.1 hypothetical protein [Limnothrix sp. FACHB-406]MBD2634766.1 hypothetical protein [Limnothrix sp. FACHB-881]